MAADAQRKWRPDSGHQEGDPKPLSAAAEGEPPTKAKASPEGSVDRWARGGTDGTGGTDVLGCGAGVAGPGLASGLALGLGSGSMLPSGSSGCSDSGVVSDPGSVLGLDSWLDSGPGAGGRRASGEPASQQASQPAASEPASQQARVPNPQGQRPAWAPTVPYIVKLFQQKFCNLDLFRLAPMSSLG